MLFWESLGLPGPAGRKEVSHAWYWEFCYCMVLVESIISPVDIISIFAAHLSFSSLSISPSYHPYPTILFLHITTAWLLYTFLVSVVSPCCIFTSENLEFGTTDETLMLVFLVLAISFILGLSN